jgi:hypothetical protein
MDHHTPISDAERRLHSVGRVMASADKERPALIEALRQEAMILHPDVIAGWTQPPDAIDVIYDIANAYGLADAPEMLDIMKLVAHPLVQKAERQDEQPPPHDSIPDGPATSRRPAVEPDPPLDESLIWDAGEDDGIPPPRQWLLGNHFCKGFISGIVGPGGTGKSAVRLLQFLSCATGRKLTGDHVFRRSRVLLVGMEDGKDELRRRILAARLHHGITLEELKGWLICWTPKGVKLAEAKYGTPQAGALERQLRKVIEKYRPDILGLDPFIARRKRQPGDGLCLRPAARSRARFRSRRRHSAPRPQGHHDARRQ